jgi:hypothetical protein
MSHAAPTQQPLVAGEEDAVQLAQPGRRPVPATLRQRVTAAAVAGALSALVVNPLDVVKVRGRFA